MSPIGWVRRLFVDHVYPMLNPKGIDVVYQKGLDVRVQMTLPLHENPS